MLKTGTLGQTHGLSFPASVVQVDHTLALCIPAPMLGPEQSAGCSWFTQYTGSVYGACLLWALAVCRNIHTWFSGLVSRWWMVRGSP